MKFRDEKAWTHGLSVNAEGYGRAIYDYAQAWAELMERRMDEGATLEAIAKKTSHEADTDGITGFMYGAAVSVLSQTWEHGEALRRWHNLATKLRHEGEEANRRGSTLNPALLCVTDGEPGQKPS